MLFGGYKLPAHLRLQIIGRLQLGLDLVEFGAERLDDLFLLFKASRVPSQRRQLKLTRLI